MTEEETRQVWKEARTFEDLCGLTIEFIQRKFPRSPGYMGEINDETDRIQHYLVRLNAMGFLTLSSQPAEALAEGCAQRAAVRGFMQERLARQFAEKELWSDLYIEVSPPDVRLDGRVPDYRVLVTIEDGQPYTWFGCGDPNAIESFKEFCSPSAIAELEGAWNVVAIDLAWGREDHLWDVLLSPLKPGHSALYRP